MARLIRKIPGKPSPKKDYVPLSIYYKKLLILSLAVNLLIGSLACYHFIK